MLTNAPKTATWQENVLTGKEIFQKFWHIYFMSEHSIPLNEQWRQKKDVRKSVEVELQSQRKSHYYHTVVIILSMLFNT